MNPHAVFCPNPDCPARGQVNEGNIWIHARTPPRYRCTISGKTFSGRAGTLYYRRSTDEATITCVVDPGGLWLSPIRRPRPPSGCDARRSRTGRTPQGDNAKRCITRSSADRAILGRCKRTRSGSSSREGSSGWRWRCRCHPTLARRDGQRAAGWALIARLWRVKRVHCPRRCWLVDGFAAMSEMRRMARSPQPRDGKRGRCRLVEWPGLVIRQVVKLRASRSGGWGDAATRAWHCAMGETVAGHGDDPDGLHRTAQRDVSRSVGEFGAPDAGIGPDGRAVGAGDVAGGSSLRLLHAAPQSGAGADTGDGGEDQRPCLEHGRTAALPGASRAVERDDEMGETHEGGGGGDCTLDRMTTVPHPPTSPAISQPTTAPMHTTFYIRDAPNDVIRLLMRRRKIQGVGSGVRGRKQHAHLPKDAARDRSQSGIRRLR